MTETRRWGKAGVRLTDEEAFERNRRAVQQHNKAKAQREESDRIGHRLWQAGELQPYLITHSLDALGLYGPEVDVACGAAEPDVDLWEAGKLYPTWEQLVKLAALVGKTPRFLCTRRDQLKVSDTSLRFHGYRDRDEAIDGPVVWSYSPEVVAATVGRRR